MFHPNFTLLKTVAILTFVLFLAGCFHEEDCSDAHQAASETEQCSDENLNNDPDPKNNNGPVADTGTPTFFVPKSNTYYRLQTMFLENDDKCLEGNKLAETSTLKGAAFMDDCQNVSGQFWKFTDAGDGYFRLSTLFLKDEDRCFEGNKVDATSTLGGAAFMDSCQSVSGQLWKAVEDTSNAGYFRLQTKFLENDNKCLEGNLLASTSTLSGAAFMDNCQDVTGQLWKFVEIPASTIEQSTATPAFVPDANKYYTLQTLFLKDDDKCLEGNLFDPGSTLEGAAFMDTCQNVSGQYWKFINESNGYYQLTTQFQEGADKCLEGNKIGPTSTLGGASFMAGCGNFSGQFWKIVPDASGYYRLQTMGLESENMCYEGNMLDPNATLKGAAFMDSCQDVSGQLWIINEL